MNNKQKVAAVAASAALVGMLLYPPFVIVAEGRHYAQGFHLIFAPQNGAATVNVSQLTLQIVVISMVGLVLGFVLKDRPH